MNRRLQIFALMLLPLSLAGFYFFKRPFGTEMVHVKVDTSELTTAQKFNIERAAKKLNGIVLKPGQQFSFNGAVGPRTPAAGYLDAPTYVANGSASTAGGGICVISSALYQAALLCDLPVKERAPHMKTMQTVKPGLDATVWYGGVDLKFNNSQSQPIEIDCTMDEAADSLTVKVMGERKLDREIRLSTSEIPGNNHTLAVEVYKHNHLTDRADAVLVSRDLYRTSFETSTNSKANHTSR